MLLVKVSFLLLSYSSPLVGSAVAVMSLWLCGTSLFARPNPVLPAQSGQLIIAPLLLIL